MYIYAHLGVSDVVQFTDSVATRDNALFTNRHDLKVSSKTRAAQKMWLHRLRSGATKS